MDTDYSELETIVTSLLITTDSNETEESQAEVDDLQNSVISKEELRRIDAQPNPFNFSDRVSQTVKVSRKVLALTAHGTGNHTNVWL